LVGVDGLRAELTSAGATTPAEVAGALSRLLAGFDGGQQDDIAIVAIGVPRA